MSSDVRASPMNDTRRCNTVDASWPPSVRNVSSGSTRRPFSNAHAKKPPTGSRRLRSRIAKGSNDAHVLRFLALAALSDVELHRLALFERPVTVHLDLGVVNEHVLCTFARDEAVALLGVEKFHCSCCQLTIR